MLFRSIIVYVIYFFISLSVLTNVFCNTAVRESEWLHYFKKYLKDHQTYQVMLICDLRTTFRFDEIIPKISQEIPTTIISFQEAKIPKAEDLKLRWMYNNPRATTVFVVIDSYQNDLVESLNFISQLSQGKSRPKCLIVQLQGTSNKQEHPIEELLRQMWTKPNFYLDLTILQLQKIQVENMLLHQHREIAIVNRYNPFTDVIVKQKYSSKDSWFPKKLYDLHRFGIKIGFYNFPPTVTMKRNEIGHAVDLEGPTYLELEALSKAMNFKILPVASNPIDHYAGEIGCRKEKSTGLLHQIVNNEIHMIGNLARRYAKCGEKLHEWSRYSKCFNHVALIPIYKNEEVWVSAQLQVSSVIIYIGLMIGIWLFTKLAGFKTGNWPFDYIIRMVFGWSVPQEPSSLSERVLFGWLFMTFSLCSSFIYTSFTDIYLQMEEKHEIKTIEGLISSDLKVVLPQYTYKTIFKGSEGIIKQLMEKVEEPFTTSFEECVQRLIKEKNIACITVEHRARIMIQENLDHCGKPQMKIVDEAVYFLPCGLIFESGSPYVAQFDDGVERLVESGLSDKWWSRYIDKPKNAERTNGSCTRETKETTNVRRSIILIVAFGYGCSLLIFIGEVLLKVIVSKFR